MNKHNKTETVIDTEKKQLVARGEEGIKREKKKNRLVSEIKR